jgi:hypothetical protein
MERVNLKRGYYAEIEEDPDPQSPDDWGNTDMFLIYDHRDFTVEREGFDAQAVFEHWHECKEAMFVALDAELFDGYYVLPVFAYIHSGVALSLSKSGYPFDCPWDVSFKGFALVQKNEHVLTMEKAREMARMLVDEWNVYLSGNVYGYTLFDKKGKEVDSCWGYYGIESAKEAAAEAIPIKVKVKS